MTETHKIGQDQREDATLIRKRARFYKQLATYVIINVFLTACWFLSDSESFWPIWVMLGWGIGIAFGAVNLISGSSRKK